ncbi:MAG: type II toxin-antitoxin system VapC family toxin [Bosea sp. (in: a-proteobacteria)]|uniref:type II toxin-antitoxin system VapC family toxin n=1 Tax=Bosea sp. (in: a-proteobacteria) TaxID=1871050 RepID=UPI002736EEF3|nr:type II toxin-antitoxin system VapC family toxin [Bosea sp. (in: a-proteobacteria)]MDP3258782.1 type II toxin-antitoxin system VapC family toxin [Bosea sp. (in: a-proteobacteria)]MDP3318866.1 type II toxin-antitoxin system VapC family toxin [Bosea sp. (in: a-proteobacteria)]
MIVVDASAVVSMLAGEADAEALLRRLAVDSNRSISTISVWETACAIARWKVCSRSDAMEIADDFMRSAGMALVAPDMAITALAVEAAERYGLGGGRPGILNMGDCFSYATARHLKARLLFKGDDFSRTDIEPA